MVPLNSHVNPAQLVAIVRELVAAIDGCRDLLVLEHLALISRSLKPILDSSSPVIHPDLGSELIDLADFSIFNLRNVPDAPGPADVLAQRKHVELLLTESQ